MPRKTLITMLVLAGLLTLFAACAPAATPTTTPGAFGTPTGAIGTATPSGGGAAATSTALIGGGAATSTP